jgi:O-antigen ligase
MSGTTTLSGRLFFLATAAVAGFPLWPMKMTVYLIGIWFAIGLFEHLKFKDFNARRNLKWMLLFTSVYLIYVLAFLTSGQSKEAFHTIERKFALLVFPIGFYLFRRSFDRQQVEAVLIVYQLANLLLAVYLYAGLIPMIIAHGHLLTVEGFNYAFRHAVEHISGIHPTYLSILFLSSVFLQLKWITEKRYTKWKWGLGLSWLHVVLLTLICLLLAARGPIFAATLAFLVVFSLRNWKKGVLLTAALTVIFVAVISFFPVVGNRFLEAGKAKEVSTAQTSVNSANIRMSIHQCAVTLISANWIGGVGIENTQNELNRCYKQYNNAVFSKSDYNTHNQYFDILLSLGIFGFLLFTLMMVFPLYHAIVKRNEMYLFFVLFMMLCFATENLLSRQYGVVFFAFFNSFFAHVHFNKRKDQ